ncbi:MAG: hypothetical protein ACTHQ3_01060 [Motilibacteraceae bacterium]
MEGFVLFLFLVAGLMVAGVGMAVVLAVSLVMRLGRGVQSRAGRVALQTAAYGAGPRADAARLRLELARELGALRSTLAAARAHDWPVGDAPALSVRLARAAAALDVRLRAVAEDPLAARAAAEVARIAPEARALAAAAGALRVGLLDGARSLAAPDVSSVVADCTLEAQALRQAAS